MSVCGSFLCDQDLSIEARTVSEICSRQVSCSNIPDLEKIGCPEVEKEENSISTICNNICEKEDCVDESKCNGYIYGLWCYGHLLYLQPSIICNGVDDCMTIGALSSEERLCEDAIKRNFPSCLSHDYKTNNNVVRPIFNFTRCATIMFHYKNWVMDSGFNNIIDSSSGLYVKPYCLNYMDQTNCSDPDKVAVRCHIQGYGFSSVSKMMVCGELRRGLCENKMDLQCIEASVDCSCHKHQLCDGVEDCGEGSDEDMAECLSMTEERCYRNYRHEEALSIPTSWLGDGLEDCLGGIDENSTYWPTCGFHATKRYVIKENIDCKDVFLCRSYESVGFIELPQLCDGLETCGNENNICKMSRGKARVSTTINTAEALKIISYCVKGLHNIEHQQSYCISKDFNVFNETIYGVYSRMQVIYPDMLYNCNHLYGEAYLYLSCLGRCLHSTKCPIRSSIKYNDCKDQFKDRVYTLVNNNHLTFVSKKSGKYTNDYFPCANNLCVEYSQVCDLVDNCGDGSDELNCTNHFKCGSAFIPITQKCDGAANCEDWSDECNEQCGKQVINGLPQKVAAFGIGFLATIFNIVVMIENGPDLKECKSRPMLANKIMIMVISIGDFLTGQYLFSLAIVDYMYGANFCKGQLKWLSSKYCSALGVISTIGSQISVVSLAILSICRVCGIKNSMVGSNSRLRMSFTKILVQFVVMIFPVFIVTSLIALAPLLPYFEDLFVNGLTYDTDMKLFIEQAGKDRNFEVIQGYFGRAKIQPLKWSIILSLMRTMFSNDYGNLDGKVGRVDFYGNDGVCLFKYFVHKSDPMRRFSLTMLSINILCFAIVAMSYFFINAKTIKDSSILIKGKTPTSKMVRRRNQKLQRKIAAIIGTNFVCWIPFVNVSGLHYFGVIDASAQYSLFSIVILPINSVINPFIYSARLKKYMVKFNPAKIFYYVAEIPLNRIDGIPLDSLGPATTRVCTDLSPSDPSLYDPPSSDSSPSNPSPSYPSPSNPSPSDLSLSNPSHSDSSPSDLPCCDSSPSNPSPFDPSPSDSLPSNPYHSNLPSCDSSLYNPSPSNPSPSDLSLSNPFHSDSSPSDLPSCDSSPSNPSPFDPSLSDSSPSNPYNSDPSSSDLSPSNPSHSDPSPSDSFLSHSPSSDSSPPNPYHSDPSSSDLSPSDPSLSDPPSSDVYPSNPSHSDPPPFDPSPSNHSTSDPSSFDLPPSDIFLSNLSPSDPSTFNPSSDSSPSDPSPSDPSFSNLSLSDPSPSDPSFSNSSPSNPSPSDPSSSDPSPSDHSPSD